MNEKKQSRLRRAKSTRLHIRALGATRLCVNRTPRHIYAQVISADGGKVLAQAESSCIDILQQVAAIKG
ncbi:hypothetical protein OPU39_10285, partial [Acinetobacter nosocomialis]|nr:hypothetical protein [Acinetobacter nosocomialis]